MVGKGPGRGCGVSPPGHQSRDLRRGQHRVFSNRGPGGGPSPRAPAGAAAMGCSLPGRKGVSSLSKEERNQTVHPPGLLHRCPCGGPELHPPYSGRPKVPDLFPHPRPHGPGAVISRAKAADHRGRDIVFVPDDPKDLCLMKTQGMQTLRSIDHPPEDAVPVEPIPGRLFPLRTRHPSSSSCSRRRRWDTTSSFRIRSGRVGGLPRRVNLISAGSPT